MERDKHGRKAFRDHLVRQWQSDCEPWYRFTRSSADLHAILADLKAKGVTVRFLDNPAMNLDTLTVNASDPRGNDGI